MTKTVVLKDINFSGFKAKLEKNSRKYGYKFTTERDSVVLTWDDNWLGVNFDIIILPIDERSFIYEVNAERVLRLVIVLVLVLLIVFYKNLLLFVLSGAGSSLLLIYSVHYQSEKKTAQMLESVMREEMEEEQLVEEKQVWEGERCPACGEPLTEYDEYCPGCGLYLGKVWKRQPVSRTGFENIRLEYKFKSKDSGENQ